MLHSTNDIKLNDMKLLNELILHRNGHDSLQVVFNNKFYGVNLPILHKTYSKMAFLVDNLIIYNSLSTLHNKKITNIVLDVHT